MKKKPIEREQEIEEKTNNRIIKWMNKITSDSKKGYYLIIVLVVFLLIIVFIIITLLGVI